MKNIMLVYIVTQLLSTAYGIAVIESVKPVIEKSLEDKGYVLRNKNSLYRFNNKISNVPINIATDPFDILLLQHYILENEKKEL